MSTKKVPTKKSDKKIPAKKAAKKIPTKKAAKKAPAKKATAKKVAAKKTPARKATKKSTVQKEPGAFSRGVKRLGEIGKTLLKNHGKQIGMIALTVLVDNTKKGKLKTAANIVKKGLS